MKKIIYFFFLVILFFALVESGANSIAATKNEPLMRLYFTEFKTKTYIPLTMGDIENRADYRFFFYKKNSFLNEIKKTLESKITKKEIDNECIRLKIIHLDDRYYVDCNGVVLKNNKEAFLLSDHELKSLERQILKLNGVVDMRLEFDALEY